MPNIRTKFIAEGEKEYKEALKSIDNGMKVLQSESKKLAAQFEDNADSAEALNAKNKNLDESVLNLKDKLELQEEWLKKVGAAYGEADERTMRMKKAVNDTETALIKAEKELKNNTEALKEYGDGADNAGDNSKGLGDALDELGSKFGISLPNNIKGTLDGMVKIDGQSMALIGTCAAGAAAIVVVEKALIDLTVQQAEWAKEIESGSSQLGMSTESYQQLDYVMQSVGYSMDQAKGDLSALAEKAQDAASGSGEAAEMFDRLGVSVTNTDGTMKSQAQLFTEVYSALAQMSDVTDRNAIASKLLGTTGEEAVIPMLEKYGRAIEQVASAAPIVKDEDIQKLASLSDLLGMFEAKMEAAKSKVAAAFAPALEQVIQIVGDLAMQFAEFAADTGLVDLFGTIIELAGNLLQALEPVLDILNLLKPVFQAIGGVLALFADAVKVVVNAVGALTDTLDYLFSFGQKRFDTSNIQSIANVFNGTDSSFGRWMGSVAHNAAGTDNWRGGLTWVGENGPELVNLPKGSQVLTNQESRGVGGDTFNIRVDMSQISDIQKLIDMANNYRRSVRMGYGG